MESATLDDVGLGGLMDDETFDVIIGSKTFKPSDDWGGYIGREIGKAIDRSASGVHRAAQAHISAVSKYIEHFHGTRTWNGRLVNDSNRLQRRSGKTIDAFKAKQKVTKSGAGLTEIEGKMDVGMFGIHLTGGTISARRSKYLTIPLPSACDRRGVPLKKSARDWPNTFVIRSKRGNLLICTKNADGSLRPLYLLKSSVRIPARLSNLPQVWDAYIRRFERAVVAEIEKAIDNIPW